MSHVRQCPSCGATYAPHKRFCMLDGSPLSEPLPEAKLTRPTDRQSKETSRLRALDGPVPPTTQFEQETYLFPRQEPETFLFERHDPSAPAGEPLPGAADREAADRARAARAGLWLETQRAWLRLTSLMLADPGPSEQTFAAERDLLDQLLDQFEEWTAARSMEAQDDERRGPGTPSAFDLASPQADDYPSDIR